MKIKSLVLSLLLVFSVNTKAVDMVFDFEAAISHGMQLEQLAQQTGLDTEQLTNMIQQLQQAKMLYDQTVMMYNNFTGLTKGGIDRSSLLRLSAYLPAEYQQMINMGLSGGGFGLSKQIAQNNLFYPVANMPIEQNSETIKLFEKKRGMAAIKKAQFEESFKNAEANFGDLQTLLEQIRNSEDMKTTADLTAQVGVINAALQNENNKLFAMTQANKAEDELIEQREKELKIYNPKITTPSFGGAIYNASFNKGAVYGPDGMIINELGN